ncbi:hypothetical protein Dsin_020317 [Dipteronia sinensis]|uniref:Uncharacterized protein n=1 Tax=Dipteronia sinensis TaxID=43782 RepID=A0AAE0A918_9ROSI|nr:hypothetical protein Dsin_020317 [Dipteronia sinensis]
MGEGTENDILKPTKPRGTKNDILKSTKASGGVGVSSNQVIYINFEEGKDLKGANFCDPAIDLFVDLGGLEHFGRKRKVGNSVESLCSSSTRQSNKNFFLSRSHRMKTRSGVRGIDFNAVDDACGGGPMC